MVEFWLQTERTTFHFQARFVSIGSDRRCTLVMPAESVKPLHAVLHGRDGRLWLERRDPTAVTFLNYSAAYGSVELFNGDVLDVGPWTLVIQSNSLARRPDKGWTSAPERTSWGRAALIPAEIERWRSASDSSNTIIVL